MSQRKIVIDDAVPFAKEMFSHLGTIITLPGRAISHADLVDADALIVRSRTQVNQALLQNTAVKFVGSTVVGLDHVDQDWLKANDIVFYSAQGCNANSVAEFVMTQLFQVAEEAGFNLQDKTLGIIGVGNVGSRLAKKADILGIRTLLNDPPRQHAENLPHFVDLKTAFQADIISFHTPLTQQGAWPTHHLLSKQHLDKINPNIIIINAARGGIIDETAWVNTPTQYNLIDCWEKEPHINEALYKTAHQATPHIAGHSLDAKIAGSLMVYETLCQFWQTPQQNQWQQNLPQTPAIIEVNNPHSEQHQLMQIMTQAHNPQSDDHAIRAPNIAQVIAQFEDYRRHYPQYREWQHHRVAAASPQLHTKLMALGFKILNKLSA